MEEKPLLTVNPTVGRVGTYFIVTGTDFRAGEEVTVYYTTPSGEKQKFPPTYMPDKNGRFSFVPYDSRDPTLMEIGTWELFAVGNQSGEIEGVHFEVIGKPLLIVSPTVGTVGTYFKIRGIDFLFSEEVIIYYVTPAGEKRRFPSVYKPDKNGQFSFVPYNNNPALMEIGTWELFATGSQSGKSDTVYFNVVPEHLSCQPKEKIRSEEITEDVLEISKYAELLDILRERFNESELRDLCFALHIDYETLAGEGKATKTRELILYLARRKILPNLVNYVKKARPDIVMEIPI